MTWVKGDKVIWDHGSGFDFGEVVKETMIAKDMVILNMKTGTYAYNMASAHKDELVANTIENHSILLSKYSEA